MKNYRKLILGIAFLACSTFIAWAGIIQSSDLVGLATIIGAMAGGTFGLVWGNVKEHQADGGGRV